MRAVVRSMAMVMAGLLVAGCGDSTGPKTTSGNFSGTLTGDLTGTRSGKAVSSTTGDGFVVVLAGANASDFSFSLFFDARPTPGTYTINEDVFGGISVNDGDDEYDAYEGTVTITTSTTTVVSGTFDVTMESIYTGETVTFKGSFSAKPPALPTGGSGLGTFTSTFSGNATGTTTGTAFFDVETGTFLVAMQNAGATRTIALYSEETGRLSSGTYSVGDGIDGSDMYSIAVSGDNSYFSTGGSVTISSSSASTVAGTFSIDYENVETGAALHITGSFNSKCVPGGTCS